VLESPVQSGLLSEFGKTETETSLSNAPNLKKPDRNQCRQVHCSLISFVSLETGFLRLWSQPVLNQSGTSLQMVYGAGQLVTATFVQHSHSSGIGRKINK
jgi:hypothetical protein